MGDEGDRGDLALPPPPPAYESPSVRRKATRELLRVTRREGEEDQERVQARYGLEAAMGETIRSHLPGRQDHERHNPYRSGSTPSLVELRNSARKMEAAKGGRRGLSGEEFRSNLQATAVASNQDHQDTGHSGDGRGERVQAPTRAVGLLMAPSRSGGEKGGPGEGPAHPKLLGGASAE
jgi:hypothetical protein